MGQKIDNKVWTVEFVGDYFQLMTTVGADNEEQAKKFAEDLLNEHYGFDMEKISNEINIYEEARAV